MKAPGKRQTVEFCRLLATALNLYPDGDLAQTTRPHRLVSQQ
jgi:hypothetical protein